MGGLFNWTPWELRMLLPPGDNIFARFSEGLFTFLFLKPSEPFPTQKEIGKSFNWTPLMQLPPGDKISLSDCMCINGWFLYGPGVNKYELEDNAIGARGT